jgi:hypothetical protein
LDIQVLSFSRLWPQTSVEVTSRLPTQTIKDDVIADIVCRHASVDLREMLAGKLQKERNTPSSGNAYFNTKEHQSFIPRKKEKKNKNYVRLRRSHALRYFGVLSV